MLIKCHLYALYLLLNLAQSLLAVVIKLLYKDMTLGYNLEWSLVIIVKPILNFLGRI